MMTQSVAPIAANTTRNFQNTYPQREVTRRTRAPFLSMRNILIPTGTLTRWKDRQERVPAAEPFVMRALLYSHWALYKSMLPRWISLSRSCSHIRAGSRSKFNNSGIKRDLSFVFPPLATASTPMSSRSSGCSSSPKQRQQLRQTAPLIAAAGAIARDLHGSMLHARR